MKKILCVLLLLVLLCPAWAEVLCEDGVAITEDLLVEYGYAYYSRDEVALYLHAFCELPVNFITKKEAMALGWVSSWGNLWDVADGACIGGDVFGNREGNLPDARGRGWYACDIDYDIDNDRGRRNGKRIVFSNDGLIYYTEDHYDTFELLYEGWYFEDAFYYPPEAA